MFKFQDLPRPFFVLAPMDDVTDTVFRQVVAGCAAPDLYFTEFVNVDGLQSPGREKLLKKLRFTPKEQPLIAQIWGKNPDNFYKTARELADGTLARELGLPEGINFAGVDLNMGCPEKTAVRNGTCSALMNDRTLTTEIIQATQQGLDAAAQPQPKSEPRSDQDDSDQGNPIAHLPLSVKTRLGFTQPDLAWIEFLLGHHLQALTIHGRTKVQMSKVPADWNLIGQARQLRDRLSPDTLIIGNGDVLSRQQGLELAQKHHLDGIMIGRGIFHDPFVFAKPATSATPGPDHNHSSSPWPDYTEAERRALYAKHIQLFAATWQHREHPIQTLNKFCKIYINNFDGAVKLREQLMQCTSTDELQSNVKSV
jgi:tRNA-dihydrouridine synthase